MYERFILGLKHITLQTENLRNQAGVVWIFHTGAKTYNRTLRNSRNQVGVVWMFHTWAKTYNRTHSKSEESGKSCMNVSFLKFTFLKICHVTWLLYMLLLGLESSNCLNCRIPEDRRIPTHWSNSLATPWVRFYGLDLETKVDPLGSRFLHVARPMELTNHACDILNNPTLKHASFMILFECIYMMRIPNPRPPKHVGGVKNWTP